MRLLGHYQKWTLSQNQHNIPRKEIHKRKRTHKAQSFTKLRKILCKYYMHNFAFKIKAKNLLIVK